MKLPQTFTTRAKASKEAERLRKTYVSVVVHRQSAGFGVSYDETRLRADLPPNKRKARKL